MSWLSPGVVWAKALVDTDTVRMVAGVWRLLRISGVLVEEGGARDVPSRVRACGIEPSSWELRHLPLQG